MGTITITAAGFAATPASAPAGWPSGITYPGAVAPNGSRQATITDAEMLQLITWVAATQITITNPTVAQILVAWVQTFFNGTKAAIQNYFTIPASVPPPIGLS